MHNRLNVSDSNYLGAESSKARVLIADDHSLIVEAVGRALESTGQFEFRTVSSMTEAFQALTEDDGFSVALVDVRMPGVNGLDTFARLVDRAGDTPVVLFSGGVDPRFVEAAVKLGVRGLIPKSMNLNSLASALNLVISGEIFLPAEVKQPTGERVSLKSDRDLSDIETRILRLAADGYMNKEIGQQVDCTEVAVKMHMRSICQKLRAKNRTHAAMIARDIGLV